jgi:hypothetical protein
MYRVSDVPEKIRKFPRWRQDATCCKSRLYEKAVAEHGPKTPKRARAIICIRSFGAKAKPI